MTKLNQLIAVEKGVRSKTTRELTEAHRLSQNADVLSGVTRTYQPRDDDGERLPGESTLVQVTVEDLNERVRKTLTRLFDVTATKDRANTVAVANVKVDGQVLLADVPVTYLLFLEKQLVGLRTYVLKLATLDPAFKWEAAPEAGEGRWRTAPVNTTKTKKVPKTMVLYEATKEHPAQVTSYTEDVVIGDWTTVRFSGAVTQERKQELLERVDKLAEAVKFAREEANGTDVSDFKVGDDVFDYLFE